MEIIKDSSYIINKVNEEIENFCINQNIDNLRDAQQKVFTACLMSAGRAVFFKGFFLIDKNKGLYDFVLIDKLIDYYIFICNLFNKVSGVYDFSLFVGIDYRIFNKWNDKTLYNNIEYETLLNDKLINDLYTLHDEDIQTFNNSLINIYNNSYNNINVYNISCDRAVELLTAWRGQIISKLHTDREQSLTSRLISNQNAIGTITAVNKEYAWNVQQVQQITQARALTLSELPKLENI